MALRRRALAAALVLAAVCLGAGACRRRGGGAGGAGAGEAPGAAPRLTIAVIPKGATHEHWKAVHAGALKAAREIGAEILWKAPVREDDLRTQVDIVDSMSARKVSGICLAPLNEQGLAGVVRDATAAGIPVVIMDSGLRDPSFVSFIATDNFAAGRMAGERLSALIGGKGRVLMLPYQEGSDSTIQREKGFLNAMTAHPGIGVVASKVFAGPTVESAFKASENLLAAQKAASGGVDGIFASNESATFGMLLALRKAGLAGKIRFVGFDRSDKLLEALAAGEIHGLVVQNPFEMGYQCVKTLAAHLRGQPVDKRIDTGATLVTRQNLGNPAVARLVHPDLKTWLGED
jgi:ribose transport system substrate-binding protein